MAAALVEMTGGTLVPVPGGVLIRDKVGVLMGAVGVSGDTSDNDEAAAVDGIEAAGCIADYRRIATALATPTSDRSPPATAEPAARVRTRPSAAPCEPRGW